MKLKLLIIIIAFAVTTTYAQGEGASYSLTFDSNWSQAAHPHPNGSLPSNAHWSRLVGSVHNNQVSFLEMGELATTGIENIAELGNNTAFSNEVNTAITAGTAIEYVDLGDLDTPLGQITGNIEVSLEYHRVTLLSMIAPSPDWIIAVNGVSLLNDAEEWAEEIVIDLYAYDAGTDNGVDYTSANSDTNPAQPISSLQGTAPFSSEKLGTLTFTLEAELSTENIDTSAQISIFPNPTHGIFKVSLPQATGSLRVFDITGKLVKSQKITSTETQLDYSDLSTGLYVIDIESGSSHTVQRLMKR